MIKHIVLYFMFISVSTLLHAYEYYYPITVIKGALGASEDSFRSHYFESRGLLFVLDIGVNENANIIVLEDTFNNQYKIYDLYGKYINSVIGPSKMKEILREPPHPMFINDNGVIFSSSAIFNHIIRSESGYTNLSYNYDIANKLRNGKINYVWKIDILNDRIKFIEGGTNIILPSKREYNDLDSIDSMKLNIIGLINWNPNLMYFNFSPQGSAYLKTVNDDIIRIYRAQKRKYISKDIGKNEGIPAVKSGEAFILTPSGIEDAEGKIKKALPEAVNAKAFVYNNSFYVMNSNEITVYDDGFKILKKIKEKKKYILGYQNTVKGLAVLYMNTNGMEEWRLLDNNGNTIKTSPSISGITGEYLIIGSKNFQNRYNTPDIPYIGIYYGGKLIREWRYGEKDIIHKAKVLNISENNELYIQVKYFNFISNQNYSELLKYDAAGKFLNRIEGGENARFTADKEGNIFAVEDGVLKKYEYGPFQWSIAAEQAVGNIALYLDGKIYSGNKTVYNKKIFKVPESLMESLQDISMDWRELLRDEIYARKGSRFDNPVVTRIFEGTKWYKPARSKVALTGVEKVNAEMLGK